MLYKLGSVNNRYSGVKLSSKAKSLKPFFLRKLKEKKERISFYDFGIDVSVSLSPFLQSLAKLYLHKTETEFSLASCSIFLFTHTAVEQCIEYCL